MVFCFVITITTILNTSSSLLPSSPSSSQTQWDTVGESAECDEETEKHFVGRLKRMTSIYKKWWNVSNQREQQRSTNTSTPVNSNNKVTVNLLIICRIIVIIFIVCLTPCSDLVIAKGTMDVLRLISFFPIPLFFIIVFTASFSTFSTSILSSLSSSASVSTCSWL